MDLNLSIWVEDPKTKEKSVSLTLVVLATVLYMGAIVANISGISISDNLIQEFWFGSCALYFGRRISFSKDGKIETERNEKDAR